MRILVCKIKKNFLEHEELLREMGHINQMPTSETFMMKKQVEKLQSELRQERAVGDHQKSQTERRYQDEVNWMKIERFTM